MSDLFRNLPMPRALAAVVIAVVVVLGTNAQAHIKDHPLSLRSVLGHDIDGVDLDERLVSTKRVLLFTSPSTTVVTFRARDDVFTYAFNDPGHLRDAQALIVLMSEQSQVRLIVDVKPNRSEKFIRFFRVHAVRLMPKT